MSNIKETHESMQAILREEVTLRQEILSNLSQQEYVLLIGDIALREELYNENLKKIHHLKMLLRERGYLTRKLFDILPPNTLGKTLEEILDPLQEIEAETLLLYQNVRALVEKIHEEHLRIKTLSEMIQKEGALEVDNRALRSEAHYVEKGKKPSLITIDYPKGEHPK